MIRTARHIIPALILSFTLSCGGQIGPEGDETAGTYGTFSTFPTGTEVRVCNIQDLPFRFSPSPSAEIIRFLPEGTRGVVQDRRHSWYNLAIEGKIGWAYGTALCRVPASQPAPPSGNGSVRFTTPSDGAAVKNGVWFRVAAPQGTARVEYWADHKYMFASSTSAGSAFAYQKTFEQTGQRTITARAFDSANRQLSQATIHIDVEAAGGNNTPGYLIQNLPYFYQYLNALHPSSSCQNTSMAMVLAYYGWHGKPDTVTAAFGKDKAQSPAGLASVFNHYAQQMGSPRRLRAHTSGTLSRLHELLSQGKPVIVHGYFTASGHVVVITGYDGTHYTVNDPAGRWNQAFKGGYSGGYSGDYSAGHRVRYGATAFRRAMESTNGYNKVPLWFHEVR